MAANSSKGGESASDLDRYRAKRDAGRTHEPFGSGGLKPRAGAGSGLFVVHKHAATRLHYDVRLELGGVLQSWAVPKGPSLDPGAKRMAVHVEPHPLDYAEFEGLIPEGNYGAGAVIVWDRGLWVPLEDPVEGLEQGKLLFDFKGYKLRGTWTLVRTKRPREKRPGNQWLLIKKTDGFADPGGEHPPPETSVLSGMTIEELRAGPERGRQLSAAIAEAGAEVRDIDAHTVQPMLCTPRKRPFSDRDWVFELKYDGYRLLASARGGTSYLRYRSGHDATALFPEIAAAMGALPYPDLLIDGEIVVFDDDGRVNFHRLQQRSQLSQPSVIKRAAVENPTTLVVFDLLGFAGLDVRGLPLGRRKELLRDVLPAVGPLKFADHIAGEQGEAFFAQVEALRLEGVVAKKLDSRYHPHRSDEWYKIRVDQIHDFAVIGYSATKAAGGGVGSLHLAVWRDGVWDYAGRVGSGFRQSDLDMLYRELAAAPSLDPAQLTGPDPLGTDHVWVEPALVCTVRYKDWREGGLVRQASFLGMVADKSPRSCARPRPAGAERAPPAKPVLEHEERVVRLSNLDKVFWPEESGQPRAFTKGDLIDYYRAIAPWLLPYLRDRLLVLTRYPDGIHGKSFFQKDAPTWVPEWIRTEVIWSEHAEREIHYFMAEDVESLVFLANLGTIPLHIWSSRLPTLSRPDWTIIDLDPKGAPFEHVVRCAKALRKLCNQLELPCYCKTSGSTGLHVLIPLGGQCTYEQGRDLAHLLAKVVEGEHGEICTTTRSLRGREGKVYLDYLQNGHGRLLVSPYSVREKPGATVSAPLRWREVNAKLDIRRFTIETMIGRVQRMKSDPLLGILRDQSDLPRALALLSERLKGAL